MAMQRTRQRKLVTWIWLVIVALMLVQATSGLAQNADAPAKAETEPAKPEQSTEAPLPKKAEVLRNLPSKADLLTKPPFDWVVLKKDDTVLVVKPVQPRPKTLEQMAEKRKQFSQSPKPTRMAGESLDAFTERSKAANLEATKMAKKLESIEVELPDTTKVSEEQDDASYLLNIVRDVSDGVNEAVNYVGRKGHEADKSIEAAVSANPYIALAMAAGMGLLVGAMSRR